ncbi:MAG: TIGR04376 family protein [Hydrococcus sp. Prado102]|jgi:uncharacterized protein (TIGR04376 family)|nr:TIGR04376 family protein [Hydrococcus sp. Prado102]
MSLFDEVSRFLETRLEEFLKNNPHLELQALLEQLREQEQDTIRLVSDLERQKQRLENEILSVAQEIKTWHLRIDKAKAAGRADLAQAAQEREAALLRQGNQLWGQMEGARKRILQSQELLRQIQQRKQEVQAKAAQAKTAQAKAQTASNSDTIGWDRGSSYNTYSRSADPLEAQFQDLETNEELERLKRNLGR